MSVVAAGRALGLLLFSPHPAPSRVILGFWTPWPHPEAHAQNPTGAAYSDDSDEAAASMASGYSYVGDWTGEDGGFKGRPRRPWRAKGSRASGGGGADDGGGIQIWRRTVVWSLRMGHGKEACAVEAALGSAVRGGCVMRRGCRRAGGSARIRGGWKERLRCWRGCGRLRSGRGTQASARDRTGACGRLHY